MEHASGKSTDGSNEVGRVSKGSCASAPGTVHKKNADDTCELLLAETTESTEVKGGTAVHSDLYALAPLKTCEYYPESSSELSIVENSVRPDVAASVIDYDKPDHESTKVEVKSAADSCGKHCLLVVYTTKVRLFTLVRLLVCVRRLGGLVYPYRMNYEKPCLYWRRWSYCLLLHVCY